jgi:CO/xanthine dehydrogenase Mo-binding subunit
LVTGKAVLNAVEALRDAMMATAAEMLETSADEITIEDGFAFVKSKPDSMVAFAKIGEAFDQQGEPRRREGTFVYEGRADDNSVATAGGTGQDFSSSDADAPDMVYGFNAAIAELEVNEKTGQVRLLKIVNAADPGTIINPQAVQGQIDGGVAFGIGTALMESFHPDKAPTLRQYGLPTTRDVAHELESIYIEEPCPRGPFGAKSVAEMSVIAPVPAIINAIADATGHRVKDIPATPARVLAALTGDG